MKEVIKDATLEIRLPSGAYKFEVVETGTSEQEKMAWDAINSAEKKAKGRFVDKEDLFELMVRKILEGGDEGAEMDLVYINGQWVEDE